MTNLVEITDPSLDFTTELSLLPVADVITIQSPDDLTVEVIEQPTDVIEVDSEAVVLVDMSEIGSPGPAGVAGPPGASFVRLYGIGAPSASVNAALGNEYLNTANGDLYSLTSSDPATWTYHANIFTTSSGGGQTSASATTYFQNSASSVWEFAHSYSYRPEVDTYDQSGEPIIGDTSFPTSNTVRVTFGFPMTGSMRLL